MKRPIRVLHVVGAMNRGGVETWLLNVMRRWSRDDVAIDLMVHTDARAAYDDEVESLGATIHPNPSHRSIRRYGTRMRRILREAGPYDVVHSHVHHYSGVILGIARALGVPHRIAHSHNDTRQLAVAASFRRRLYENATRILLDTSCTTGLAVSDAAAVSLFGCDWRENAKCRILYCGINARAFGNACPPGEAKRRLSIPGDAFVVGHVGRFEAQKNHKQLIEIFARFQNDDPRAHLLLIGDGPLRQEIERRAQELALNNVHFCGARADVPDLFQAMDLFLFPSFHEGLPLVCLEAQAAGIPILMSDRVTSEVIVRPECVAVERLDTDPSEWVSTGLAVAANRIPASLAMRSVVESAFDIDVSAAALASVYSGLAVH